MEGIEACMREGGWVSCIREGGPPISLQLSDCWDKLSALATRPASVRPEAVREHMLREEGPVEEKL